MHYSLVLPLVAAAMQLFGTAAALAITSSPSHALEARSEAGPLAARSADTDRRANNTVLDHAVPFPFDDNDADEAALSRVFDAVRDVPDDVLHGGRRAIKAWFRQRFPDAFDHDRRAVQLAERQNAAAIAECVLEIVKFLAENGPVPQLKILRIRKLINSLGGTRAAVKALLKAKTWKELVVIGGPALEDLASELLGYGDVAAACLSFL